MISILSKVKNVKRKISEVGEKPCWLCVVDFHNQQPRGDSLASGCINDINLESDHKNATGGILTSLKGENAPLGSRKSSFSGGEGCGDSPLLDSIVINRYVYFAGLYR